MEIFLDLDGLLADIHAVMLHQLGIFKYRNKWPKGMYYIREALSLELNRPVTEEEVWHQLDVDYLYQQCRPMEDARQITTLVKDFKICTALHCPPQHYADLARGKIRWCQKFFGVDFTKIVITDHKWELATPNRILIDDLAENVDKWREAGGSAFLYARPWNDGKEEGVLGRLESFLKCHRTLIRCPVCRKQIDLVHHPDPEPNDFALSLLLGDSRRIHASKSPNCKEHKDWILGCIREKVC